LPIDQILKKFVDHALKFLTLKNQHISDSEAPLIAQLPMLKTITLSNNLITDQGFRKIIKLRKLEHLDLSYNALGFTATYTELKNQSINP
jgi:Leucine-rich repeat (LRR) protein